MKILLAEDEPQLNHVINTALSSVHYEVTSVFHGEEAVEAAEKKRL